MTLIQIIPERMIKKYDSPPQFSGDQRKQFSYIPRAVQNVVNSIRTPHNKLGFLMNYFYFRIMGRFYLVDRFSQRDLDVITRRYKLSGVQIESYSSSANSRHQEQICELLGFKRYDESTRKKLLALTIEQADKQVRPRLILGELVSWLLESKIESPGYYQLAEIITIGINRSQETMITLLDEQMSETVQTTLDTLIGIDAISDRDTDNTSAERGIRNLSSYNHSRTPKGIRDNCERLIRIQSLLSELPPMENMPFSSETVRYYATATLSFDTHQLVRRNSNRYLFLYCFLVHQRRIIQDILIDTILLTCQGREKIWKKRKDEVIIQSYEYRNQLAKRDTRRLSELRVTLDSITTIMQCTEQSSDEKLLKITAIIEKNRIREKELVQSVQEKDHSEKSPLNMLPFYFEEKDSTHLQHRIAGPLKCIAFDNSSSDTELYDAVKFYQDREGKVTKKAPTLFLSEKDALQLWSDSDKFRISLYKVFLYKAVIKGIKSGRLNLKDSYKYQSLESYLINFDNWSSNREQLLCDAKLDHFSSSKTVLDELQKILYAQRDTTENHLRDGINTTVKLDKKNRVVIDSSRVDKEQENLLSEFFPDHSSVRLFQMLSTIDEKTSFSTNFDHQYLKNVKKRPSLTALFAGIIGFGCNIGIPQMGQMLKNMPREDLEYATQWYFSLENITNANNSVLALIQNFELSDVYKSDTERTHTSSDGQKFTVAVESLHASYSHKYFGTQKGVSIYSFIDDTHKLYYSTVMVPAEREASYVIDGLLSNEVVKSDMHSTDTHGYSEIIFAVTHFLDISFAPRIKNIKTQQLYKFKNSVEANKEGWKMVSAGNINSDLIEKQWDEILLFMATIKLKVTTASQLFKRINSYSNNHPLYTALKQFGRIIKTIFILKYIDDIELRQVIEKQLNRIESYHKFAKAIFFGRNQEVRYATKKDQEVAEACKRFIANVIICWNYMYISTAIVRAETVEEKSKILKAAKNGSMVSWQHINFQGEYDFSEEKLKDKINFDLDEVRSIDIQEILNE